MDFQVNKPLLTFADVACVRGGRLLFEHFSLALNAGECVEIHGANGSGKSTLLRAAAGLFTGCQGEIQAASCAYLGHKTGLCALLTPRENLLMQARLGGGSATQALGRVGLLRLRDVPCGQLSQGQQRRVGVARLLLGRRGLWLLDEPLSALDEDGRRLVRELVAAHCDGGGAALCATHQSLGCPGAEQVRLDAGA